MDPEQHKHEHDYHEHPENETRLISEIDGEDWICGACYTKICSDDERFIYKNRSEFRFTNKAGESFNVITFLKANEVLESGYPTMEFTWFPGHKWVIAVCGRCYQQLGWKYTGPKIFFGLIRGRIVKAMSVMN